MQRQPMMALAFAAVTATACFHQTFQSGLEPSETVVDHQYVSTWLWGIVAAQPVDTRQACPRGVAKVETEQSFMNGLVGVVTLGIYSPQHLLITCAA